MENQTSIINVLIKQTETYVKSSAELYKLQIIQKSAAITSTLASRLIVMVIAAMFFLITSIGVALWIGSLFGKSYIGFFIVGGFFAVTCLVVFLVRNSRIKMPLENFIITQALN